MSNVAVSVENLGKQFRIGRQERPQTFRELLSSALMAPVERVSGLLRGNNSAASNLTEMIWSLKDVSFNVNHGEVIGIIGRNGAGKSTLLKILARITTPTEGTIKLYGRVGALLEVGTGFHPELTGRENVYLNGAILGMKREEIKRKFDEIVAFSEVEKFIDTPVKHYSSGMGLRLGFAVAAHLEPEILIVDEVLAVGDSEFQKKCLGKMGDVANDGRTVLFVSHQMGHISRLCQKCVWLDGGHVRLIDNARTVVNAYEAAMVTVGNNVIAPNQTIQFVDWYLRDTSAQDAHTLKHMNAVTVTFGLYVRSAMKNAQHSLMLYTADNHIAWSAAVDSIDLHEGVNYLTYHLDGLPLVSGVYQWYTRCGFNNRTATDWYAPQPLFIETPEFTHPKQKWRGILNAPWNFELE